MLFFLIGTVATIVATYFTFKTANENGRRGILWALVSLAVGFGLQLIGPFFLAMVIAVVYLIAGTTRDQLAQEIDGLATIGYFVCWLLSFVGLFLIIKFVSKLPETDDSLSPEFEPPPPPTF